MLPRLASSTVGEKTAIPDRGRPQSKQKSSFVSSGIVIAGLGHHKGQVEGGRPSLRCGCGLCAEGKVSVEHGGGVVGLPPRGLDFPRLRVLRSVRPLYFPFEFYSPERFPAPGCACFELLAGIRTSKQSASASLRGENAVPQGWFPPIFLDSSRLCGDTHVRLLLRFIIAVQAHESRAKGKKMSGEKKTHARPAKLERLSRNPRASRQRQTLSGKPIFNPPYDFQEIRESLRISQAQLAQAAGIPAAAIANVEAGRYVLAARKGVQIFAALARMAPAGSELQRQAEQSARKLADDQNELNRKHRIAVERQVESGKKKIKELDDIDAEIELAISGLSKG